MNTRMSKESKTTLFLALTLAAVIFSAIHSNQYFMLGTDTQKSNEQNKRFGLEGDYDDFDDLSFNDDYATFIEFWLSETEQQLESIVAEGDYDEYDILDDDDLIIEIEAEEKVKGETTESTTRRSKSETVHQ